MFVGGSIQALIATALLHAALLKVKKNVYKKILSLKNGLDRCIQKNQESIPVKF